MRAVFVVLGLALIALVIGFLPKPFFKPDWRTPYEMALAADDCAAANRILQILKTTGFYEEASEAEFQNSRLNRCNAEPVAEHNRDMQNIFATDSGGYISRGYFEERWRSSFLGSRFFIWQGRTKLKMSEIVNAANQDARNTMRQCLEQYPGFGGLPNYHLLKYAIATPGLLVEEISKISREQKAQCVRKLVAALKVMKAAARTPEDRAAIAAYWIAIDWHLMTAPEQASLYAPISTDITDDDLKLAFPGMFFEGAQEPIYIGYTCLDNRFANLLLIAAIRCANDARLLAEVDVPLAALYAVYYSRRAKRLGWRDVQAPENTAKARLTGECFNAIVKMEAEDAGDKTDPRDFVTSRFPVNPGEPCFAEAVAVK